jgi:hypothetical protein
MVDSSAKIGRKHEFQSLPDSDGPWLIGDIGRPTIASKVTENKGKSDLGSRTDDIDQEM